MQFDWDRIERFVGFGTIEAPVVFIGMEEGLANPDALDAELQLRSSYSLEVIDLREASIGATGYEKMFDPRSTPIQKTWKATAHVMLCREGVSPDKEARRRYFVRYSEM